jgi:DNA-binding NarL/FixJ family response regulator
MQVLIIESFAPVIHRLEEMLSEVDIVTAIYSTVSYDKEIDFFIAKKPDVVLLGISLSENKSIKLIGEIKAADSKIQVIVLSMNMDEYIYNQCKSSGADYFLDKYHDFEKLPEVISAIKRSKNLIH